MFCQHCHRVMKYVMEFESHKAYSLYRCPQCHYETRRIPLVFYDEETKQNKYIKDNRRK